MPSSAPTPAELAAQAAAANAAEAFNTEAFTLLAIGLVITFLRTYSRIVSVGVRSLALDDVLAWFAAICYAGETALAYSVGNAAHGLANNGMTNEQRAALSPEDPEHALRVLGSKIQLAGWTTYGTLLWALKGSLLVFYLRLTSALARHYRIRIYIGFVLVVVSYMIIILNLYLGCRPFHHNWQINPDPGNVCQPAVSGQVVWVYLAFNVVTDTYLLTIPLPMLWAANLKPFKKIGLMILFSGGIFVIACAILRCVLIVTDPINGAQLAGSWAVRETFVAVVTTNLPMIFPLIKRHLGPYISTWITTLRSEKLDDTPLDVATHGTGGGSDGHRSGRSPLTSNPITNGTFSESEEHIVGGTDVRMQDLQAWNVASPDNSHQGQSIQKQLEIAMSKQVRAGGSGVEGQCVD